MRGLTLICAILALALPAAALASGPWTNPPGHLGGDGNQTGQWYTCTIDFYGQTYTKAHQGPNYAANLEAHGWTCTLVTPTVCVDGPNAAGVPTCPAEFVATPSSSFMCRILDANEPAEAILDSEILSTDPGTRSLANGWLPAAYDHGKFVCEPVANPTSWTDDSLSVYDAPNTAYANPVAG